MVSSDSDGERFGVDPGARMAGDCLGRFSRKH